MTNKTTGRDWSRELRNGRGVRRVGLLKGGRGELKKQRKGGKGGGEDAGGQGKSKGRTERAKGEGE